MATYRTGDIVKVTVTGPRQGEIGPVMVMSKFESINWVKICCSDGWVFFQQDEFRLATDTEVLAWRLTQ